MNPEQAWSLVKPRVDALNNPDRAVRTWRFDTVRGQLAAELKPIRERADTLAAVYAAPHSGRLLALIESVDQLSLAGTLVQAQLERTVTTASPYMDVVTRAQALRKTGLHWLETLERFGAVTAAEGDAIRAGRGHLDTAGDLQALASLVAAHWDLLAALQPHQKDPALRLTEQSADDMRAAALALVELARATAAPIPGSNWADAARRLGLLLERDWDDLRSLTLGAQRALGELTMSDEGRPSLAALYRRA